MIKVRAIDKMLTVHGQKYGVKPVLSNTQNNILVSKQHT